ncbi:hypothetical protein MASR2M8_10710 [Opitutaceae bacterium]
MVQPAASPSMTSSTWSISRDQVLQSCERKFFFQYLSGGRLNGETPELRQIALLKKLQPYAVWLGDVFHRGIAEFLNSHGGDAPLTADQLISLARQQVVLDWRFSSDRTFIKKPYAIGKEGAALLEHFYEEMPAERTAEAAGDQVATLLERFLSWAADADLIARMKHADRVWIEPDAWGPEAPGFWEDGVQVITKVDLAFGRHGERFEIFDWKSGRASKGKPPFLGQHELQVGIYQLWPLLSLGVDAPAISSNLVYFGEAIPVVEPHTLDNESLPLLRSTLRNSVRLARQWEQRFQSGEIVREDLSYAYNLHTCRQCGFRQLCRQTLDHPTHA